MSMSQLTDLVLQAENILLLGRPPERQRQWRQWERQIRGLLDEMPEVGNLGLQLDFDTLPADIGILDRFLRDQETPRDEPEPRRRRAADHEDFEAAQPEVSLPRIDTSNGKDSDSIKVFLSYLSEDEKIARLVRDEIASYGKRIEVFKASDDLRAGTAWKKQLREEIEGCAWFLMIYTDPDKDWQWPVTEATHFEFLHRNDDRSDRRLCCLHDSEARPKLLADYQIYRSEVFVPDLELDEQARQQNIAEFYENSQIYRFLWNFLSYPDDNPIWDDHERVRGRLIESSRKISEAFFNNRQNTVVKETYYPARLELAVNGTDTGDVNEALNNATVYFGPIAKRIFSINEKHIPWTDFKGRFLDDEHDALPIWIDQLEDALKLACKGDFPNANTAVMYSSFTKSFYRPLLSRQEYYLNGMRRFYIVLAEQPPVDFSAHDELGLLLASLILGARFRFEFIDRRSQQLRAKPSDEEFGILVRNMERQICAIEAEAAQHGLMDEEALINCFTSDDREIVTGWYQKWQRIRQEIFEAMAEFNKGDKTPEDTAIALRDVILGELSDLNHNFMIKTVEQYHDHVVRVFSAKRSQGSA